jgi:hypothetical protein
MNSNELSVLVNGGTPMMRQLTLFCVKIIMMSVVMFACIGVGQAL